MTSDGLPLKVYTVNAWDGLLRVVSQVSDACKLEAPQVVHGAHMDVISTKEVQSNHSDKGQEPLRNIIDIVSLTCCCR